MNVQRSRIGRTMLVAGGVLTALLAGCQTGTNASPSVPTIETSTPGTPDAALPPAQPPAPPAEPPAPPPNPNVDAPARGAAATGPAFCSTASLRVTVGRADPAAGTIYRDLKFTNVGSQPCVLNGFPGVSYVTGDNGQQVGQPAQRFGPVQAVTVAPGVTAHATVGFTNVRNYDEAVCQPVPVRGIRIYPPEETNAVFIPLEGTGCAGNPPSPQLSVRSMEPGPGL